jgi:hypothetical protein
MVETALDKCVQELLKYIVLRDQSRPPMKVEQKDMRAIMTPAENVFQFSSSASLEKLTGHKAYTLDELVNVIRSCPDSSIFYHTFSAFRRLREVRVPYANDFALWVSRSLNEEALAEKLATINLTEHNTIEDLRTRILEIVEGYRSRNPLAFEKRADEPFYLFDAIRIVWLTDKFAYDLKSLRQVLEGISLDSLYFHFIEARLRTGLHADDFSTWIERSLKCTTLAQKIRSIDINVYTLEELRKRIGQLIDEHLNSRH